eukprot:535821-Rhodomonas_salina.2
MSAMALAFKSTPQNLSRGNFRDPCQLCSAAEPEPRQLQRPMSTLQCSLRQFWRPQPGERPGQREREPTRSASKVDDERVVGELQGCERRSERVALPLLPLQASLCSRRRLPGVALVGLGFRLRAAPVGVGGLGGGGWWCLIVHVLAAAAGAGAGGADAVLAAPAPLLLHLLLLLFLLSHAAPETTGSP